VPDSGKCILAIPDLFLDNALVGKPERYQVSLPVKYVLEKGWRVISGHIFVKVPYDSFVGAQVPEEYYEYT
jgi:hypothetical protein